MIKKWLIIAIVVAGFVLRIIGLSSHPAGFTPDEASFGYDAYSILKTGRDQWGNSFPLVFKSFGDDKLPVYTYLTIPSVAIFGLNEFAVRFPNAILGTFAIVVIYFLVKELFKREDLAILSAFLLAVSPWHVMLSRGAFEANLTTFFLPFAILLFYMAFDKTRASYKTRVLLILSAIFFGINLFTYHTARILTPLIVSFLIYQNWNEFRKNIVFFGVVFGLFLFPAIYLYLVSGSRVASSGIFDINYSDDRYLAQVAGETSIISRFFYNKPFYIVRQFLTNYFSYFSPQFLILSGPSEGTYGMVPGVGVVYFTEIVFLCGFVWKVVRERSDGIGLIIFSLLISPIPAALTKGPGYAANRVAIAIVPLVIVLAIGGVYLHESLKGRWRNYFIAGYCVLFVFNFIYVGEKYLVGQTVNQAPSMIYGTKQVVEEENKFQGTIFVSKNISEPQIYFAFYTKMNPILYQAFSRKWVLVNGWVDQQGEYSLGRYDFRNINYSVDGKLKNTLLVGTSNDFPAEIKPDFIVNYPNLKPAYLIVKTR